MADEAYVWIYLPTAARAVVCGRLLREHDDSYRFVYGRSYKSRDDAIPLAPEGMALDGPDILARRPGALPGPIRDASPDAWARYAIEYRLRGTTLDDLDLLLEGHGDRIGALDFSTSATELTHVSLPKVTLKDLESAARGVQEDAPLPAHLLDALRHGTSIGGARPKSTLNLDGSHWIAKFSASTDIARVVRWEGASLTLAQQAGIRVPNHRLERVNQRDVLLVERFDRQRNGSVIARKIMLTALTLLDLDDTEGRLASYPDLAEVLLRHAHSARADRTELFRRMVFNILIGNEDDHAKNHACFWDGRYLSLTPAYDILPQPRAGQEGRQAMIVGAEGPRATLANALTSASQFGLQLEEAHTITAEVRKSVETNWERVFKEYEVPQAEIDRLRATSMLSPVAIAME